MIAPRPGPSPGPAMSIKRAAGAVVVVLALAGTFLPSEPALERIKEHEALRTTAYLDAVRIPTICYGSTAGVRLGQKATPEQCNAMLRRDASYAGAGVARQVKVPVTQGQYDALVSFVFNVGESQFSRSTLLRKLNAGDCTGAAAEFSRWVFAKGKRLGGLVKRRAVERKQFEEGCTSWAS